jgi:hypothetical protein
MATRPSTSGWRGSPWTTPRWRTGRWSLLAVWPQTEPARVTVGNFRKEVVTGAVCWDVAMQYERPAQMWSMRRSANG